MDPPETRRRLAFYFDYISHNAYLAWSQLGPLAHRYNLEVEPVPVLFAGLLNANGQLGPAEIPAKASWMARDVIRKATLLGVPLAPPASHPFNPLLSLRVSSVPLPEGQLEPLVQALFEATWVRGLDVSDVEVVASIASDVGLNGEELVARAGSAEIKSRLRAQNDDAIKVGVFGVPSMVVDSEVFWGFDDFPHLELYLLGEDPLRGADLEAWFRLRPTAQRARPKT